MPYATIADLIAKYGAEYLAQLTNTDPNNNVPDPDRLQCALDEATAEIDMYLGKCYDVPLTVVPDIIKFKILILARYYLETSCSCADTTDQKYEATTKWLHELCCGECPPSIGIPKKSDRADGIAYYATCREFTKCSLSGYTNPRYGYGGSRCEGRDRNYKYYS